MGKAYFIEGLPSQLLDYLTSNKSISVIELWENPIDNFGWHS